MATMNVERQRTHRGRVSEITGWWRMILRRAGLLEHWTPSCIGPRELAQRERLRSEDHPGLYPIFADAYRQCRAEELS